MSLWTAVVFGSACAAPDKAAVTSDAVDALSPRLGADGDGADGDGADGDGADGDGADGDGVDSQTPRDGGFGDDTSDVGGADAGDALDVGGAGADAGTDAGTDAGADAEADAGTDAGADAGGPGSYVWALGADKVTISWTPLPTGRRLWTLKTTHPLRDNLPASKQVVVQELAQQPILRTGHAGLDAVYALALQESRDNSAKTLSDNAFNAGKPVTCACYATGEKWPWAWTRDVAYAVALGLGDVDPTRSATTLLFKTALPKVKLAVGMPGAGAGRQVVQDTGTGGSWPVSTDRVVWALGAEAVLDRLTGSERAEFAAKATAALANTLATDRIVAWDPADGLYRGEESFLDWREQSYPSWAKTDLVSIASAKALSTNVLFWHAHRVLARLASEAGDGALATTHAAHAQTLGAAIKLRFALPGTPLLSALVGGRFDPGATRRFELLGNALAVALGLVTGPDALALIAAWPMSAAGPPVQWPQQPGVAIYHNRALWPFVTAWHALAAARAGHAQAVSRSLRSLTEFAALNLSHMENLEFLTGKNYVADGTLSGPVVNSRRQLWSVAGFIGAIHQVVFGMETGAKGLRFHPKLPVAIANAWLAGQSELRLEQLIWRGHALTVIVKLPPQPPTAGMFELASAQLDGKTLAVTEGDTAWLKSKSLGQTSQLVLTLQSPAQPDQSSVATITAAPMAGWMAPMEPAANDPSWVSGKVSFTWSSAPGADGYDVFRDGELVASAVKSTTWTDPTSKPGFGAHCYAVAARAGELRSHHSRGRCIWGDNGSRIQTVSAFKVVGADGAWKSAGALPAHLSGLGATGKPMHVAVVHPRHSGGHALQLVFRNQHGPTETGVACATARVRVRRLSDNQVLADGRVVMPQQGGAFAPSTPLAVELDAKEPISVTIDRGDGLVNMSMLDHYTAYNGGPGGGAGLFARFDLAAVRLLSWSGPATTFTPTVQPNGKDDFSKLTATNAVVPGAQLAAWGRFAMTWDARFITVVVVSKAFEQGLRPFMLYVETSSTAALEPAKASVGMPYGKLTAKLPFTPSHVVTLRSQTDAGDGAGPWSGIFERTATGWTQIARFEPGVDSWLAADKHTLTVRIARAALGATGQLRMAGHVVWGQPGHEWKDIVPSGAAPWKDAVTGYYQVDLSGAPAAKSWALK